MRARDIKKKSGMNTILLVVGIAVGLPLLCCGGIGAYFIGLPMPFMLGGIFGDGGGMTALTLSRTAERGFTGSLPNRLSNLAPPDGAGYRSQRR